MPASSSPRQEERVGCHAAVGCASAAASGGNCRSQALAGGVGALAGNLLPKGWSPEAKFVAVTVIGGTTSVIGGGKFADGAVTAAFAYLFNRMAHAEAEQARNTPFAPGDRYVGTLSVMFETSPDAIRGISIPQYSDFADQHGALAVTRINAIYLNGSGDAFFADPKLTLHEYYHALRQWNTGGFDRGPLYRRMGAAGI